MGSVFSSWYVLPATIYAYSSINYDPMKPWQNKMSQPRGAVALTLPLNIKEEGQISPTFFPFFTSPTYKAAWNETRRQAYNTDRVELDPTLYKDYRPGASMRWLNGKYVNEADKTPGGPRSVYDYNNRKSFGSECPCHQ